MTIETNILREVIWYCMWIKKRTICVCNPNLLLLCTNNSHEK